MEYEIVDDISNVFNKIIQNALKEEKVSSALFIADKFTKDGASRLAEHKNNISSVLFFKKLENIFSNLDSVDYQTRIRFLDKYINGREFEFAEDMILFIDQINQMKKCEVFANLLKSVFYIDISIDDWNNLNWILLNLSYVDINKFAKLKFGKYKEITSDICIVHERNIGNISESSYFERLKMIGLFGDKDISISLGSTDSGTKLYILTDIGIKFYEVLNKYNE